MSTQSTMKRVVFSISVLTTFVLVGLSAGCASAPIPPVGAQAYAKLPNHRTFEYEFPTVWKAIEAALQRFKVLERNPKDVDPLEMKKLTQRDLETDWIYAQSRDKYQEYRVNDSPRKIYLQTRLKYRIEAKKTLGGTDVVVSTSEEIEKLRSDGSSAGYETSESPDSSRASEILDRINNSILSAAP